MAVALSLATLLATSGMTALPFGGNVRSSSITQTMLRDDISRRVTELYALGWLGRAYLFMPAVASKFLPKLFQLELYEDTASGIQAGADMTAMTLKESSIVARGIPFRMLFRTKDDQIVSARLLSVGCDLLDLHRAGVSEDAEAEAMAAKAKTLCDAANSTRASKAIVVRAIVDAIFGELSEVSAAIKGGVDLEACAEEVAFLPEQQVWAREGSTEKWLQQVSGYYFAEARLQQMRFVGNAAAESRFTFYLDPTEPVNGGDDPRRNINPEVIACTFGT